MILWINREVQGVDLDGSAPNTDDTAENMAETIAVISSIELPTESDDYGIQHSIPDLPSSDTDLLSTGRSSPIAEELSEKSSKEEQAEANDIEQEDDMPEIASSVCTDYSLHTTDIEDILGRRDSSEIDRELQEIHALTNKTDNVELSANLNSAEASDIEKGDGDKTNDPEGLF